MPGLNSQVSPNLEHSVLGGFSRLVAGGHPSSMAPTLAAHTALRQLIVIAPRYTKPPRALTERRAPREGAASSATSAFCNGRIPEKRVRHDAC